ncbi:yhhN-like family protein [Mycobacterium intracellulare MIN_061107_1834]|nr:yhhN-like family protein [Mycobacterium intracellulare MIN_061107_1834]
MPQCCCRPGRLGARDPWWTLSFEIGLAAFLLAHMCFIGALLPLVPPLSWSSQAERPAALRIAAVVLMCLVSIALLVWFWPHLGPDKLTLPVTVYIVVLTAMVCTALLRKCRRSGRRWGRCVSRLGFDDRDQPLHPGQRGARRADLVVVRGGPDPDHGGILLRPRASRPGRRGRRGARRRLICRWSPVRCGPDGKGIG